VRLTSFSLRNPIVVTLCYGFVAVIGLVAYARMGRSVLPPIAFPVVVVTAPYAGAGPEEIDRLVVAPIVEKLETLPDRDRVSSLAQDGVAAIVVRFRFGSNLQSDRANVQQAVDAARAYMPLDVLAPSIGEQDPSQAPVLDAAVESAVLSPRALAQALDNRILPALRSSSGIGAVSVEGEPVRQFAVVPRPGALEATSLTALDIFRTVAAASDVLPGGRLHSANDDASIGIASASQNAADLRALPVGSAGVRVGDVAGIVDGYADPSTLVNVDGRPAVLLHVSRSEDGDALRAIAAARKTLKHLAVENPLVRFTILGTEAPKTTAAIAGVLQTLGEGVVLTVLVMLVFLHAWRNAAIAAIAIPASILATFGAMWIAGFTIDVLSLMGLSLTVGILVDDSIVIIEAIVRASRRGLPPNEAALAGRRELGGAAVAITLADVAVFAPIALTSGLVGAFMREFGLVVVFATAFSLLVSFTLTPLLAARWSLSREHAIDARMLPWMLRTRFALAFARCVCGALEACSAFEEFAARSYAYRWLPAALQRKGLVIGGAIAATLLSLLLLGSGAIGAEFSPPLERGEATVDLRFPAGTPLERSELRAERFASALLDDSSVGHVVTVAGRAFNGSADTSAGNLVQVRAVAVDPTASGDALAGKLRMLEGIVPEAEIAGSGRGMGGTAPIRYTVAGNKEAVDAAARRIHDALEANPFATDVRLSDAGMAPRVEIAVDAAKAVTLGVAADDAAQTARIASGGAIASRLRLPTGLADVVVRYDAAARGDLDAVLRASVRDRGGRSVPLGDVVDVRRGLEPAVIERENGERVVSVTANAFPGVPIGRVTMPLARQMAQPGFLPAGARAAPRGDVEQLLDTMSKMGAALGLAIVIVYAILAILYRSYRLPLVVMATVPLASVGAFGALYLFRQPLNLYSMLGIVMLVGLVSKNGILLIEYAQREIERGSAPEQAIQVSAYRRFRPIVMTTCAMVAGMLPLALGHTIGAEYRQAMGTVVIGGLSSSLVLTLFVVPSAYVRALGQSKQPKTSRRLGDPSVA
jgi:HAE1 family hydrophobic/amphiphilic exporter-1